MKDYYPQEAIMVVEILDLRKFECFWMMMSTFEWFEREWIILRELENEMIPRWLDANA